MTGIPRPADQAHGWYEIRVLERLDDHWSAWFDGWEISSTRDGITRISGSAADQAGLHGLLQKIRDLGLTLVSVNAVEPGEVPPPRHTHQPPH